MFVLLVFSIILFTHMFAIVMYKDLTSRSGPGSPGHCGGIAFELILASRMDQNYSGSMFQPWIGWLVGKLI